MRYKAEDLRNKLQLYFAMGSNNCINDPLDVLQAAIDGGITIFQFREKGAGAKAGQEKVELAKRLQSICKRNGIPFIVNDDLELALEIDADGVHIGQEDGNPKRVREVIGDKILGISAHNLEEAKKALTDGADYLGVGPMYKTNTKKDIRDIKGPEVIAIMRENDITAPIVGIGGISSGFVYNVISAGADGVAVISAISNSGNPLQAAAQLLKETQI